MLPHGLVFKNSPLVMAAQVRVPLPSSLRASNWLNLEDINIKISHNE